MSKLFDDLKESIEGMDGFLNGGSDKSFLIIADIAGQMDALSRLVALAPHAVKISVGDMCDRGPRSKEVFDYFMDGYGKDKLALLGNHEHLMLHHCSNKRRCYDRGTWFWNGGQATCDSFPGGEVSPDVLAWVESLPLTIEIAQDSGDTLIVSHAPLPYAVKDLPPEPTEDYILDITWNREEPFYQPGYFQVFGHNSHSGLRSFTEANEHRYALCIDQSRSKILTGYLFPEGKILEVPY